MAKQYQFLRAPDKSLLRLASALMDGHEDATTKIQIGDSYTIDLNYDQVLNDDWSKVIGSSSYLITTMTVSVPSMAFTLQYYRGKTYKYSNGSGYSWEPGDQSFIDGIDIAGPGKNKDPRQIFSILNKFINFAPPVEASKGGQSTLDQSSVILNRVSEAVATLTEHAAERQLELDALRVELESNAKETLEEEKRALRHALADERQRLDDYEISLTKRAKAIDNRENTHVRRELQKNMSAIAKSSLSENLLSSSEKSFQQTRIISVAFALSLIIFAVAQSFDLTRNGSSLSRDVVLFSELRIVLLGLAAGALVWFSLKLSSSRYRQISKWENDLHRFQLDVERASFLVEGDLEARTHGNSGLPDVLLERFSQGLFSSGASEANSEGDDIGNTLSHLLSRSAKVKIGTDGVSVEVDKSGITKARKDIEKDAGSGDA